MLQAHRHFLPGYVRHIMQRCHEGAFPLNWRGPTRNRDWDQLWHLTHVCAISKAGKSRGIQSFWANEYFREQSPPAVEIRANGRFVAAWKGPKYENSGRSLYCLARLLHPLPAIGDLY